MRRDSSRAALLCLGAAVLCAPPMGSAEAQYYPRRHHHGQAFVGGLAGGLVGGLAAGAILNSTRPAPYYAAPAPVYVEPEPVYEPTCHIVRKKVWIDDYAWTYRRYRVCD